MLTLEKFEEASEIVKNVTEIKQERLKDVNIRKI